jgi:pimeloyl-ACP methyl ester carboxylesterase
MSFHESSVTCPDGRVLEVATFGDASGDTVFFHHGTPGSIFTASSFEDVVEASGLFLVTMSRAGYGHSTRREGRTVASVVDDVRSVLDALGRDRYVSVGWSGGGPHALACAALDAPRCLAVWSLAGVVPIDVDFDWTAGMGPENLEEFALSLSGGPLFDAHMAKAGEEFSKANAENIIELFGGLLPDVDKGALASEASRESLAKSCRHGFAHGYFGFYDDDRVFFSPWGFDVADIEVPAAVWYGDEDLMVPPTHGAWLAGNVPDITVTHKAQEGHISIVTNHLDELAAGFKKAFG